MTGRRKPIPEDFEKLRATMPAAVQTAMDRAITTLDADLVVLPTVHIHGSIHGPIAILAVRREQGAALRALIEEHHASWTRGWVQADWQMWAWPKWWRSAKLWDRAENRLAEARRMKETT